MKSIVIQVRDLFEFEGLPVPVPQPDGGFVEAMVRRQFEFLRLPLQIEISEGSVTISFSEESSDAQGEAARLADRAARRAAEGGMDKAILLLKRALELQPTLHKARRDMAMACMETGDTESAKNHLIEVLRLNPRDTWGWVLLGNLYAKHEEDWPTAEKFLRRALETAPDDPWALNSLATITAQRGQTAEAVKLFEQASLSNPHYPNPYYGLAVTHNRSAEPSLAAQALERLFHTATMQDARSKSTFDQARRLYGEVQEALVPKLHSEAFKAVERLRAELEPLSGFPVRVTEGEFKDKTTATIQMAWKHGRDHHLIKFRTSLPEDLRIHQMAHELTHLQLEAEARKVGKNRFFTTTESTEHCVLQRLEDDSRRLQRKGYRAEVIQDLMKGLTRGLAGFLYNCPLDMLIESRLRERIPALSASQFVALRLGANEALGTTTDPRILEVTPRLILRAGLALNGAYALFLDNLYHGATTYALAYQLREPFPLSQRLFRHWLERGPKLGPGDEYVLVDEFAEMVGLRGCYEWKADPGTHAITELPRREGTTNQELLRKKQTPAVYYLLDALKRFDEMPVEKIKEISLEIGMAGRNGLDYASPDQKYTLKSLPDEHFSGLHLMCLMFAGFKRIAPEHDLQMDLHEPFLIALEIFTKHQTDAGL